MTVDAVPAGYASVTPYLIVNDAAGAIRFYTDAFDAVETVRMPMVEKIGHAELRIGNSVVMLADEFPDAGLLGPRSRGGTSVTLMIYLPDVDATFERALSLGADQEKAVADQFYGDRSGTLIDPFGHRWTLATHVEDVSAEEMQRRLDAMVAKAG